jgi:uncharacterized membrane protein YfcA
LTVWIFSLLVMFIAYLAGLIGALTGLGGGAVLIPALVLLFHVDIHYAMGASLIAVIATSSGTAIAFLRDGYTNIRIGMLLEIGAVIGALGGALLVTMISAGSIAVVFGLVMFISAYLTWRRKEALDAQRTTSHAWATYLQLDGTHQTRKGKASYRVQNVPFALGVMTLAGALSGLLGIGSGTLKVLAMDQMMRLPYKVSTTTSSFIIGITAAVSAGVYFSQGYINPGLTFPVMLGVLLGAVTGAKVLVKAPTKKLRLIFSVVVLAMGIEMIYKGLTGSL